MVRTVRTYYPGTSFPALSVTGEACELGCDHCRGRFLKGMCSVPSPQELLIKARELSAAGAVGFLLSGGCTSGGRVPLLPYVQAIRQIKEETSLLVNVHTGLLDLTEAEELVSSGADCYSVDVVQDEATMRGPLHLPASAIDYERTLESLFLASAPQVVPHICLGLQSEKGEAACLEMVSRFDIAALIVLGLVTPRGLYFSQPTDLGDRLVRFVENAKNVLDCPILLGCMRARGDWKTEVRCIDAGLTGIVSPSPRTVEWAREKGFAIERIDRCCACTYL
jgi:lipoyl synthase